MSKLLSKFLKPRHNHRMSRSASKLMPMTSQWLQHQKRSLESRQVKCQISPSPPNLKVQKLRSKISIWMLHRRIKYGRKSKRRQGTTRDKHRLYTNLLESSEKVKLMTITWQKRLANKDYTTYKRESQNLRSKVKVKRLPRVDFGYAAMYYSKQRTESDLNSDWTHFSILIITFATAVQIWWFNML